MATVHPLLATPLDFYNEFQERVNDAESRRYRKTDAAILLQRMTRGYVIRKHFYKLSRQATIIQRAFRRFRGHIMFKCSLKRTVKDKYAAFYCKAATKIQATWRGYYSRRTNFCYRSYRLWLQNVTERGARCAAEAAEFGFRTRADNLQILEDEARQWLAFVVFKLHHLLRTFNCPGVYSTPASTELSEFEKLLKSIRYTEYMKRLRRKYEEFVRKYRPAFSSKRLFPIIGDGADYWYLSLLEMYELSTPAKTVKDTRHQATHHGSIHTEPFLWRKVRPSFVKGDRGPFTPQLPKSTKPLPITPANSIIEVGDTKPHKDLRFHLYVKHYKPCPELFKYIDYHINSVIRNKWEISHMEIN